MHRIFALFQFDDHRLHSLLGKRIEPAQELPKVGNFLLELITLIAHGSSGWFRREQTRSQSSTAAEIGAMMTPNGTSYLRFRTFVFILVAAVLPT